MHSLFHELRVTLRQLRKAPGFCLTVLITLALGIAATTVIFSLVDSVLLRPLPLPDADRLITLDTLGGPEHGSGPTTIEKETSYPNFFDWRSQNTSFSSMASYTTGGLVLGADSTGPARRVPAMQVSADFFTTVGVVPELGRGFLRQEELPGSRSVILSHETWQSVFAGDRQVLGKAILLNDVGYTVIGVMPKGFDFPVSNVQPAVWKTFSQDAEGPNPSTRQRGYNQLSVIGRLKPGVTITQAKAEMDSIQRGLAARYPDDDSAETAVKVVPLQQDLVSDVRMPLRVLFGAVCCLLLIVCANVAGLLLTRTSERRGEFAIRAAIGATRWQILRQLQMESMLLSLGAGLLGLALTKLLLRLAPALLPPNLPRVNAIALDGRVMAFAIGLSLLTGLVFGVLPAWRASQADPASALAEGGRSSVASRRHFRLQSILVVGQTAIGLVLLVGAGLLISSFDRILRVDPGFSPQQMATFRISLSSKRYSDGQQVRFVRHLLAQLQSVPGVRSATAAFPLPMTQGDIHISFSIQGRPVKPGDEPAARVSLIEPGYFETLKIPLKAGRLFLPTEHDAKGQPVAMVNEAFAKQFFPGETAVGQHIRSGLGAGDPPPMREIVGVVGDVKRLGLTEPDTPEYYIPNEQAPVAIPNFALRVSGDPESYTKLVQAEVAKLDAAVPVYRFQSYDEDFKRVTAQQRFQTLLLSGFALVAVLLAGLGLYAVLSYMVAQRTMELGLRIALGAPRGNVLRLMLVRGMVLACAGLALGLAVSATLTRFVAGLLFGVEPWDAATFAVTTLVLLAVSALASLLPAWRAAMLDPMDTLRQQ